MFSPFPDKPHSRIHTIHAIEMKDYLVVFSRCLCAIVASLHDEYHPFSTGRGEGLSVDDKNIRITDTLSATYVSILGWSRVTIIPLETTKRMKQKESNAIINNIVVTDFLYFARFIAC